MRKIFSGKSTIANFVAILCLLSIFAVSFKVENPSLKSMLLQSSDNATVQTGGKAAVQTKEKKTGNSAGKNEAIAENKKKAVVSEKIKPTIRTVSEFERNIYLGLKGQKDEIQFSIEGYDQDKYNFKNVNKIIEKEPTIEYGYTGMVGSVSYVDDGSAALMKVTFNYNVSKEKRIKMKQLAEKKATAVLKKIIHPGMTDLQKEKVIHDYIVNNTVYDYKNYRKGTIPMEAYTDYGVLIPGSAVCDGYAKAMFRLLNQAGVKCLYIVGTASDGKNSFGHAWNKVKINGKYYNVDATWDDPVYSNGKNGITYEYYNKSDKQFKKDHVW